ncbi:hypothetical protein BGZ83_009967 [Gryganskiella cystojenkinii]|nr:hypothetical protein BGZ83_009967 [Gryganskiella cystojenkinii]
MSQPSQGWGYGSGPLQGMNQARPPMSGFPNMMQSSMLQQQQQTHSHPSHQQQQEILDMSDFPALGSANNASSNPGLSAASYASTAGTLTSSNASSAANLLSQEFSIEDDFPALPGARPNSAGSSSRQFNAMQQQQLHQQNSSRSQQERQQQQHHASQQQQGQQGQQHLSQLDGIGAFSSLLNPSSGSQMQSMQLQQQLANDLMFQQQQQHQQQMLHLNGSHSPLNSHIASSPSDIGKATKSYATKASNGSGSGLFSSSLNSPLSSASPATTASSTAAPTTVASLTGSTTLSASTTSNASSSSRPNDASSTGAAPKDSQAPGSTAAAAVGTAGASSLESHDRFGLYGMLGVIRMADQDSTTLTLGRDLTTLGLSLNSADPLYGTFASPWFEVPASSDVEAEFHVPTCYNVQPPPSAQAKLSSVLDETLFYMFYSMPRDTLQDAAAAELYNRHWRYHKELRLWLMKDQSSEQSKTPTFERGSYIFFDPNSWEKVKKDFIVMYDALEERRQAPTNASATTLQANGSSGVNGSTTPSSNVSGSGVNGLADGNGAHAGLLSNLNMTASTAGSTLGGQQSLKQSGLSQNFQMQQQQQQQQQRQQQQQQQHQKSLHMMNHGLFAPNSNHGFQGVKPQ